MKKEALRDVMRQLRLLTEIEEKTPDNETVMVNVTLIRRAVAAFDNETRNRRAA